MPTRPFFLASLFSGLCAAPALANPDAPLTVGPLSLQPADAPQPDHPVVPSEESADPAAPWWTLQVVPIIWYVAPSGDITLPASGSSTAGDSVNINTLEADSPRVSPAGTLTLAGGRWRFSFSGADYSLSHTATVQSAFRLGDVSFAPGDQAHTDFNFGVYELWGAYRFYDYDFRAHSQEPAAAEKVILSISALAGARLYDVDISVQQVAGGASSGGSGTFIEPVIGVRFDAIITDQFGIELTLDAGWMPVDDHSSSSIDVSIAFDWHPFQNIGFRLGWRQLAVDLSDGSGASMFEYDGRLAGLFAGLVIRF